MGTETLSHIAPMIRNSLPEIINELTTLCSFNPTYIGPFGATPDIWGGTLSCMFHLSYPNETLRDKVN